MVTIPPYFETRPAMPTDAETLSAFDQLFDDAVEVGGAIDYRLAAPRWQFICHVADTRPVVLHGSGNSTITRFEPRQPSDSTIFGNQKAVYAASDGLWPLYFAILDRDAHDIFLINASVRIEAGGALGDPLYFFSITQAALDAGAFRRGTIYFLPRQSFVSQPTEPYGEATLHIPQWASLEPVTPLCSIAVGPEDFPLLDRMRGHDDALMQTRIRARPDGFPWLED